MYQHLFYKWCWPAWTQWQLTSKKEKERYLKESNFILSRSIRSTYCWFRSPTQLGFVILPHGNILSRGALSIQIWLITTSGPSFISTKSTLSKPDSVSTSPQVKSLGVILDSALPFQSHANRISQFAFFQWNSRPPDLRNMDSLPLFKLQLKTQVYRSRKRQPTWTQACVYYLCALFWFRFHLNDFNIQRPFK